jgi:glycolate oxidase FAD binding subunit
LPKAQQTHVFELDAQTAIERMNRWYAEANPITAITWLGGKLYVRLAGAAPAVKSAASNLGGESLANDTDWWRDWREQKHAFFAGELPVIRVACKSTAPWGDLANDADQQAIDWGGAQRWVRCPSIALAAIREWARAQGGHASVFRGAASGAERSVALQPALIDIQTKIKSAFDPYHIFSSL